MEDIQVKALSNPIIEMWNKRLSIVSQTTFAIILWVLAIVLTPAAIVLSLTLDKMLGDSPAPTTFCY